VIPRQFLRTVLAVEVVIAVIALASVAVHALWLWRRQHADRPRLDRARAALAEALTAAPGDDGVWSDRMAELGRLHRRVQRRVVQQLAVVVTGAAGRGSPAYSQSISPRKSASVFLMPWSSDRSICLAEDRPTNGSRAERCAGESIDFRRGISLSRFFAAGLRFG